MPRSGCLALHGVNPNLKKKKKVPNDPNVLTNTIMKALEIYVCVVICVVTLNYFLAKNPKFAKVSFTKNS